MNNDNLNSYKTLPCNKCGRLVENVGEEAVKVTCSICVLSAVGFPEEPKSAYKPTGRPAGWHWMKEFVDKDGTVYHLGKEQPKLKGTLPPTKVKPIKKKPTKRRTKEQILLDREKEKRAELRKAVKKQKDFLNHKFGK
jgi:phage FluMu protein Com